MYNLLYSKKKRYFFFKKKDILNNFATNMQLYEFVLRKCINVHMIKIWLKFEQN